MASLLKKDELAFAQLLQQRAEDSLNERRKRLETELNTLTNRKKSVDVLYEKCYEDNVFGKITDDAFCHLSTKYSAEKADLVKRIAEIQETGISA